MIQIWHEQQDDDASRLTKTVQSFICRQIRSASDDVSAHGSWSSTWAECRVVEALLCPSRSISGAAECRRMSCAVAVPEICVG